MNAYRSKLARSFFLALAAVGLLSFIAVIVTTRPSTPRPNHAAP